MPQMRPVTIRFGERLWSLIEDESNRDAVSAAQWIRDAALARAMWEQQRRGEHDGTEVLDAVREEHRVEDEAFQRVVQIILERARPELDAIIEKLPEDLRAVVRRWYGLQND